jgi:hypothetical protein
VGLFVVVSAFEAHEPRPELQVPTRSVADGLVALDGPEGQRLLFESEAHAAFFPLASHFETQMSLTYCGVASIAMVLNALEAPAPAPADYAPHRLFTQDNVLNPLTAAITDDDAVSRYGMTLEQVAQVLEVYDVDAQAHFASDHDIDRFRAMAVERLSEDAGHMIVNYSRSALGQEGAGHISPLGAYDAESDRFLILDVSRYKAPSVWVTAERLFAAMAEPTDGEGSRSRGFVTIAGSRPRSAVTPSRAGSGRESGR